VIGGDAGGPPLDRVVMGTPDALGTIGAWTPTGLLPTGITETAAVFIGDHVYLVGGATPASPAGTAGVLRATVAPDGTLGAWTSDTPLPSGRRSGGLLVSDGGLFLFGGFDVSGSPTDQILHGELDAGGAVVSWTLVGSLAAPAVPAVAAGDAEGLIAGGAISSPPGSSDNVVQLDLAAGVLGSPLLLAPLPEPRSNHRLALLDGYAYVLGGMRPSGEVADSVFAAPFCL
jgi:hypothetical protein